MALTDINFTAGEEQTMVLEIPAAALSQPLDILIEAGATQNPVEEIAAASSGKTIFIMTD